MALQRADSIYDIPAIEAEHTKFKTFLAEDTQALIELYDEIKKGKVTTIGSFAADSEKMGTAIDKTRQKQTELSLATSEYAKILNNQATTQAKTNALTSDAGVEAAKLTLQLNAQKKANKEVAQEALGMIDVYGRMKKEYVDLSNAAKNAAAVAIQTGNPQDQAKAKALSDQALALHETLLQIETSVGQSQRNVGNYTGAINILKTSLEEATAEFQKLNAVNTETATTNEALKTEFDAITEKINQQREALAVLTQQQGKANGTTTTFTVDMNNLTNTLTGDLEAQQLLGQQIEQNNTLINTNNEAVERSQSEVSLLTELVGQQSQGYTTLAREVMSTGKALETMASQGLENTEAFKQLEIEFVNSKRKLTEFRNEQKLLTDTAPKLQALTIAARGLGGAYAAGAGAAALFSSEDGKVEKELQKLVAVMTLLQGLQELHHLLMEKNAIATALFGRATEVTSTAIEGEAIATETATAATSGFGKALAFLAANPVIIFVAALATALIYLISTYKSEEEQLKENIKKEKEYSDSISGLIETIEQKNKLTNTDLELQKKKLEAELSARQAGGISAQEELAYKKKINDIDRQITDERLKSLPESKRDLEEQTKALNKNIDALLVQQEETKKLTALRLADKKETQQSRTETVPLINREGEVIPGTTRTVTTIHSEDIADVIEKSKKLEEILKSGIDAQQKTVNLLTKIKADGLDQQKRDDDIAAAESKLSAEERRKLALATAQIEVSATQDKNNIILNNERSTFDERISAMKDNLEASKKLAKAENQNVLTDPTKSLTDKLIAERQYNARLLQIDNDGAENIRKATLENDKRIAAAELDANKIILDIDADFQDQLMNQTNESLADRLAALSKYTEDKQTEIDKDYEHQKKFGNLNAAELIKLDQDYYAKSLANATNFHNKKNDITKSDSDKNKAQLDKQLADADRYYNSLSDAAADSYNKQIIKLNDLYTDGKISLSKYNEDRLKLDNNYAKSSVQIEINRQKALIAELDFANKRKLDLEKDLADAEAERTLAKTDQEKIAADQRIAAIKLDLQNTISLIDKESALYKALSALLKQLSQSNKDALTADQEKIIKGFEKERENAEKYFSLVDGLLNINIERAKNKQADDQAALDKKTQAEIDSVNASLDSEDEKAKKIKIINDRAAAEKAEIDKREKQAEVEQAQFDKIKALFEIAINTAIAVVKATTPIGKALAIAFGAAEAAIVLATPLPHYKAGRGFGKEELAITGDGGVSEYIHREDGTIEKTPAVDTLVKLMPKDKVYKDKQTMMKEIAQGSQSLSSWAVSAGGNITKQDMQHFTGEIVNAVKDIQISSTTITKEGWNRTNQRLAAKEAWVNRVIKGKK